MGKKPRVCVCGEGETCACNRSAVAPERQARNPHPPHPLSTVRARANSPQSLHAHVHAHVPPAVPPFSFPIGPPEALGGKGREGEGRKEAKRSALPTRLRR